MWNICALSTSHFPLDWTFIYELIKVYFLPPVIKTHFFNSVILLVTSQKKKGVQIRHTWNRLTICWQRHSVQKTKNSTNWCCEHRRGAWSHAAGRTVGIVGDMSQHDYDFLQAVGPILAKERRGSLRGTTWWDWTLRSTQRCPVRAAAWSFVWVRWCPRRHFKRYM